MCTLTTGHLWHPYRQWKLLKKAYKHNIIVYSKLDMQVLRIQGKKWLKAWKNHIFYHHAALLYVCPFPAEQETRMSYEQLLLHFSLVLFAHSLFQTFKNKCMHYCNNQCNHLLQWFNGLDVTKCCFFFK